MIELIAKSNKFMVHVTYYPPVWTRQFLWLKSLEICFSRLITRQVECFHPQFEQCFIAAIQNLRGLCKIGRVRNRWIASRFLSQFDINISHLYTTFEVSWRIKTAYLRVYQIQIGRHHEELHQKSHQIRRKCCLRLPYKSVKHRKE